ncbi:MAG: U32 family peptidase [Sporolactobacillus sp.]|nr:U32 family peptidase [Sporolactobacillus sp.]MCI1883029.1 U32 family peptidase [Sporolactobacillus sp.]
MNLIATAESLQQAEALLEAGADTLYVGSSPFALRLPQTLDLSEIGEITELAHRRGKKVTVACNALMHNRQIEQLADYLPQLAKIPVDALTVGDPGVITLLKEEGVRIPFIYDGETLVTSAGQIAFWIKCGAIGAVAARELTLIELQAIQAKIDRPVEVLVYGPTCIHQSRRTLLTNYYRYAGLHERTDKDRGLYLRDPKHPHSRYPIYQDENGTHIFSSGDLSLIDRLDKLAKSGLRTWKLDGVLLRGARFVSVVALFAEASRTIDSGNYDPVLFARRLQAIQPADRPLSTGFYLKNPQDVH